MTADCNFSNVQNFSFEKQNPFVPFRPFPTPAIASGLNSPKKKYSCEEVNMVICCLHYW